MIENYFRNNHRNAEDTDTYARVGAAALHLVLLSIPTAFALGAHLGTCEGVTISGTEGVR